MRWRRFSVFLLASVAAAGCAARSAPSPPATMPSVVIFFVDGLDHARLIDLLAADRLPAIRRIFVEGGVEVTGALTSLPSVTYANAVALLTGVTPARHGVLGNRWFDRATGMAHGSAGVRRYRQVNNDFTWPTLFERVRNGWTVSIQAHTRRGATVCRDNPIGAGLNWWRGAHSRVDAAVGEQVARVVRERRRRGSWPAVYLAYFPGVDEVGHQRGPSSAAYANALETVDRAINETVTALRAADPDHPFYFVLVSDHGMVPAHASAGAGLQEWLAVRCGLALCVDPQAAADVPGDADAVLITGADRGALLHLRGPRGWPDRPTAAQVARILQPHGSAGPGLAELPGVALVLARTSGSSAELRAGQARHAWTIGPTAPDVASARNWLATYAAAVYPDAADSLAALAAAPRGADVTLFAAEGWSFSDRFRAGHGSVTARDLIIPLFFAGGGLPAGGRVYGGRLVDVMPTVLDLLGQWPPAGEHDPIDGRSLLQRLQGAEASTP